MGTAVVSGSITEATTEADLVAGNKVFIITLTDDTWIVNRSSTFFVDDGTTVWTDDANDTWQDDV
jgi:hypothetical protein